MTNEQNFAQDFNRRKFLSSVGKGFGMMALSSSVVASLFENLQAANRKVAHLSPEQVATDEDFWAIIQQSFSVTRGIVNLNNGGVSPKPANGDGSICPLYVAAGRRNGLYNVAASRAAV